MSRTEAAGKKRWVKDESGKRKQVQVSQGKVDMEQVYENLRTMGVILRGGGADEAPQVYKYLSDVLKCHEKSIKVTNVLFPVIVCMAGSNEYDPYKD
jgi:tRNA-splicing ligase RtcB